MESLTPHPLYDDVGCADHTAFVHEVDALPPDACTRAHLVALIERAPTARARAFLWGVFDARVVYSTIAGGSFARTEECPSRQLMHPIDDNLHLVADVPLREALLATDPTTCRRSEMERLIGLAPDAESRAYLQGICETRLIFSQTANAQFHKD